MVGSISISGISKHFVNPTGERITALDNVSLDIPAGSFVSLIGPSGCGKSTTLRMIAGLERLSGGNLYMDGRLVNDVPCGERNVSMVFQNYALFPHMTVQSNIVYGLKAHKMDPAEIKTRLSEVLDMLDLKGLEERRPKDLSGGQRQAMALLMSTMTPIEFLILDEHTAALDPKTAETIMELTGKIVKEKNLTTIMVTHNLRYAVEYGDRLLMMHQGRAVVDKEAGEKQALCIDDILEKFNEISIECGN